MARKAKGKKLTLRPVRLDDDVWAECRRLGKGTTINEGLRSVLLNDGKLITSEIERRIAAQAQPRQVAAEGQGYKLGAARPIVEWRRGPRPKGDKSR